MTREGDILKEISIIGSEIDKCEFYIGDELLITYYNNTCKKKFNINLNFLSIRTQFHTAHIKIFGKEIRYAHSIYSILPDNLRTEICTKSDGILQTINQTSNLFYWRGMCYSNHVLKMNEKENVLVLTL